MKTMNVVLIASVFGLMLTGCSVTTNGNDTNQPMIGTAWTSDNNGQIGTAWTSDNSGQIGTAWTSDWITTTKVKRQF